MPLDMNCELRTKVSGMTSVCCLRERERERERERVSSELFLNHFDFKEKSAPLWCMSMVQWEEFMYLLDMVTILLHKMCLCVVSN